MDWGMTFVGKTDYGFSYGGVVCWENLVMDEMASTIGNNGLSSGEGFCCPEVMMDERASIGNNPCNGFSSGEGVCWENLMMDEVASTIGNNGLSSGEGVCCPEVMMDERASIGNSPCTGFSSGEGVCWANAMTDEMASTGNNSYINGFSSGEGICRTNVMTDEQIEVLRHQIAVYSVLTEQLIKMHNDSIAVHHQNTTVAGTRLEDCNVPRMSGGIHKTPARSRWNPTSKQLQILESKFREDNHARSKQEIKKIASELKHHGEVTDKNVKIWFQNRKARSRRSQKAACKFGVENICSEDEKGKSSVTDPSPSPEGGFEDQHTGSESLITDDISTASEDCLLPSIAMDEWDLCIDGLLGSEDVITEGISTFTENCLLPSVTMNEWDLSIDGLLQAWETSGTEYVELLKD